MLKIRRPLGRLIFNMGIAIPGKTVFLIETAPCSRICLLCNVFVIFVSFNLMFVLIIKLKGGLEALLSFRYFGQWKVSESETALGLATLEQLINRLNIKTVFPGMEISMMKIRLLWDPYTHKTASLHWDAPDGLLGHMLVGRLHQNTIWWLGIFSFHIRRCGKSQ